MSHSSRRSVVYSAVFIMAILVIVSVDLAIQERFEKTLQTAKTQLDKTDIAKMILVDHQTEKPHPVVKVEPVALTAAEKKVTPEFIAQFHQESAEIGRPQPDVEKLEIRLQSWARHLSNEEIDYLSEIINNQQKNGDERALALDLLGRNQSKASLAELKDFVLSKDSSGLDSRARSDEELIFKVQAVEEIAASSSQAEALNFLSEIQKQSDQSFVKDRVQRSINSLKGLSAAPESQDNEALKKLIK